MDRESVFKEQFDRLSTKVFSYFALCFGKETAYDLTQEVFLNVWKHMCENRSFVPLNWKAWVFRIAVNVKNDFLRGRYKIRETAGIGSGIPAENEDDPDMNMILEKAFLSLGTDDRELLILKANGFQSGDIGAMYGVSASAARSRLSSARKRFIEALEDCGVNYHE